MLVQLQQKDVHDHHHYQLPQTQNGTLYQFQSRYISNS